MQTVFLAYHQGVSLYVPIFPDQFDGFTKLLKDGWFVLKDKGTSKAVLFVSNNRLVKLSYRHKNSG